MANNVAVLMKKLTKVTTKGLNDNFEKAMAMAFGRKKEAKRALEELILPTGKMKLSRWVSIVVYSTPHL